jgi:hypothetical protein
MLEVALARIEGHKLNFPRLRRQRCDFAWENILERDSGFGNGCEEETAAIADRLVAARTRGHRVLTCLAARRVALASRAQLARPVSDCVLRASSAHRQI